MHSVLYILISADLTYTNYFLQINSTFFPINACLTDTNYYFYIGYAFFFIIKIRNTELQNNVDRQLLEYKELN